MATTTTTKTAAKQVAAKKTAAKRTVAAKATTAKKTAATKTAATKTAARKQVAPAAKLTDQVADRATAVAADVAEVTETVYTELVDAARRVAYISVGLPFVAQDRIADLDVDSFKASIPTVDVKRFASFDFTNMNLEMPSIDLAPLKAVLAEAEHIGQARVAEMQDRVDSMTAPVVKRVDAGLNMVTEKLETQLPEQVRDLVAAGRKRVRSFVAA
jgi:hypothetical protein